jgi:hypothetical protein
MSLAAVCVDRARIIVKEAGGPRKEGKTSFVQVPGQWFKCRLFLEGTTDTEDPQAGRWSSQSTQQLICLPRDLDGNPLVFRADRALDVLSKELGRAVWRLAGEPEPLRKKRRVIGYLAQVSRVVEREYDDILNQRVPDEALLGPPAVT